MIWFTTSLARSIGSVESQSFNDQLRQYALQNDIILFDVADILSHTPWGTPCYDNRDGVAYTFGSNSENYPDDGIEIPAICQEYTTETEGGHLGSVSSGKIRVVKAFWVLMARIAGWDGGITSANENVISLPENLKLYQNHPNPFNPSTKIKFEIPGVGSSNSTNVTLKIYNVLGNEITTLINEVKAPGTYEVEFNTTSVERKLSSGVYFYTLTAGNFSQTKKLVLIK
ncbi:MAG: T9SS type A sorting domain-containing protein [Ignavibacteriales bacterium]|nr:MAG: T9SS type A sorting domain-containing protein [Ignavibacteriales bacterium]